MAARQSTQELFSSAYTRVQDLLQSNNVGVTQFVLAFLLVFVVSKIVKYRQALQVRTISLRWILFKTHSLISDCKPHPWSSSPIPPIRIARCAPAHSMVEPCWVRLPMGAEKQL